ncbi:hypothetical protein B7463_g11437, partial [Scytalidium lignicola]
MFHPPGSLGAFRESSDLSGRDIEIYEMATELKEVGVRTSFVSDSKLHWGSWTAFRAVFDASLTNSISDLPPDSTHWWRQDTNFFALRLGRNTYTIVSGIQLDPEDQNAPLKDVSWGQEASVKLLRDKYVVGNHYQYTERNKIIHFYLNFFCGSALSIWAFGNRAILIGNAAHAHDGAFATGGSLAINNAYAFYLAISSVFPVTATHKPPSDVIQKELKLYEATRKSHANRLLKMVLASNKAKATKIAPGILESDEDLRQRATKKPNTSWLHEHDVVKAFEETLGRENDDQETSWKQKLSPAGESGSCMRCLIAKRTCGGYEEDAGFIIRQYQKYGGNMLPFKVTARKCSLPVRTLIPGTNTFPEDCLPKEVSNEKTDEFALQSFFYEYRIVSTDHSLSRGFFDGLESMLRHLGLQSDLSKACKVVSFANHGIKLQRPYLLQKAEILYNDLLVSLARAIEATSSVNNAESLLVATLLGLYEMIIAKETEPGYHITHAKGVAAILKIENSPLDIFRVMQTIRSGHVFSLDRIIQDSFMFSISQRNSNPSLYGLWTILYPIWQKWEYILRNQSTRFENLCISMDELLALNERIIEWQEVQLQAFKPRTAGYVGLGQARSSTDAGYWPGRVDAYFDLYIASVWNICRTVRFLLLNLVLGLSKTVNSDKDFSREHRDILSLVEDLVSSIPYYLTEDVQCFLRDVGNNTAITCPGRSVGGLLLMHPLYLASTLVAIPPEMRDYMKECLSWIGLHMGIGQASIFANASEIDAQYLASGCLIIWASLLI